MLLDQCSSCVGRGRTPHERAGETRACFSCDGYGVVKASHGAYRSQAMADAGRARRTARRCYSCRGEGTYTYPDHERCSRCYGAGQVVSEARPGDVLPDAIGITDYVPASVMASLADALTVDVMFRTGDASWSEMHLGIGTITGVVDYGRTVDALRQGADDTDEGRARFLANVDALRARVRSDFLTHIQWCKITDTATRVITDRIVVLVRADGFSVISAPSIASAGRVADLAVPGGREAVSDR